MMPMILALAGLLISGLWGANAILDKVDDITDDTDKTAVNVGLLVLLGVAGYVAYREFVKKR